MSNFPKISFWLFVGSLPVCYVTPWPAVLCMLTFIALHYDERLFHVKQLEEETKAILSVSEKTRRSLDVEKELGELRTQLNGINLKLGMSLK